MLRKESQSKVDSSSDESEMLELSDDDNKPESYMLGEDDQAEANHDASISSMLELSDDGNRSESYTFGEADQTPGNPDVNVSSRKVSPTVYPHYQIDFAALPDFVRVFVNLGRDRIEDKYTDANFDWKLKTQALTEHVMTVAITNQLAKKSESIAISSDINSPKMIAGAILEMGDKTLSKIKSAPAPIKKVIGAHVFLDPSGFSAPDAYLLAEITVPKALLSNPQNYNQVMAWCGKRTPEDSLLSLDDSYAIHCLFQNAYFVRDANKQEHYVPAKMMFPGSAPIIFQNFLTHKSSILDEIRSYITKLNAEINRKAPNWRRKEIKRHCWQKIHEAIDARYHAEKNNDSIYRVTFPIKKIMDAVLQNEEDKDAAIITEFQAGFFSDTAKLYDSLVSKEKRFMSRFPSEYSKVSIAAQSVDKVEIKKTDKKITAVEEADSRHRRRNSI